MASSRFSSIWVLGYKKNTCKKETGICGYSSLQRKMGHSQRFSILVFFTSLGDFSTWCLEIFKKEMHLNCNCAVIWKLLLVEAKKPPKGSEPSKWSHFEKKYMSTLLLRKWPISSLRPWEDRTSGAPKRTLFI